MKDKISRPVALFDLDSTLCDYDGALRRDMEALKSPNEPDFKSWNRDEEPNYIKARMNLIRNNPNWWKNLEPLPIGFEIYSIIKNIGFRIVVLTQGPRVNSDAWKGKHLWCMDYLAPEDDLIITRDKSLVYGKILVDDWPPYVMGWLEHRPRGLVIMPAHPWNEGISHKQIIRHEGSIKTLCELEKRSKKIFEDFKGESE